MISWHFVNLIKWPYFQLSTKLFYCFLNTKRVYLPEVQFGLSFIEFWTGSKCDINFWQKLFEDTISVYILPRFKHTYKLDKKFQGFLNELRYNIQIFLPTFLGLRKVLVRVSSHFEEGKRRKMLDAALFMPKIGEMSYRCNISLEIKGHQSKGFQECHKVYMRKPNTQRRSGRFSKEKLWMVVAPLENLGCLSVSADQNDLRSWIKIRYWIKNYNRLPDWTFVWNFLKIKAYRYPERMEFLRDSVKKIAYTGVLETTAAFQKQISTRVCKQQAK